MTRLVTAMQDKGQPFTRVTVLQIKCQNVCPKRLVSELPVTHFGMIRIGLQDCRPVYFN